jgi:hypothetical protein
MSTVSRNINSKMSLNKYRNTISKFMKLFAPTT